MAFDFKKMFDPSKWFEQGKGMAGKIPIHPKVIQVKPPPTVNHRNTNATPAAWRAIGVMMFGAGTFILTAWQLAGLDPKGWCNSAVDQTKITGESIVLALQSCLNLQTTILGIKDHAIIGLMSLLGITGLLFMISEFRVGADIRGPGGFSARVNNDDRGEPLIPFEGTVSGVLESNSASDAVAAKPSDDPSPPSAPMPSEIK